MSKKKPKLILDKREVETIFPAWKREEYEEKLKSVLPDVSRKAEKMKVKFHKCGENNGGDFRCHNHTE